MKAILPENDSGEVCDSVSLRVVHCVHQNEDVSVPLCDPIHTRSRAGLHVEFLSVV